MFDRDQIAANAQGMTLDVNELEKQLNALEVQANSLKGRIAAYKAYIAASQGIANVCGAKTDVSAIQGAKVMG